MNNLELVEIKYNLPKGALQQGKKSLHKYPKEYFEAMSRPKPINLSPVGIKIWRQLNEK